MGLIMPQNSALRLVFFSFIFLVSLLFFIYDFMFLLLFVASVGTIVGLYFLFIKERLQSIKQQNSMADKIKN